MAKFHIYKDKAGEWRWRFVATNGNIIATASEGYVAKSDCKRGIEIMQTQTAGAPIEE